MFVCPFYEVKCETLCGQMCGSCCADKQERTLMLCNPEGLSVRGLCHLFNFFYT